MANMSRCEYIEKIQQLGFACVDLNLYLDNNPDDLNAINLYNSLHQQYMQIMKSYEKKYGALTNFGHSSSDCSCFKWVEEPWPWQKSFY